MHYTILIGNHTLDTLRYYFRFAKRTSSGTRKTKDMSAWSHYAIVRAGQSIQANCTLTAFIEFDGILVPQLRCIQEDGGWMMRTSSATTHCRDNRLVRRDSKNPKARKHFHIFIQRPFHIFSFSCKAFLHFFILRFFHSRPFHIFFIF